MNEQELFELFVRDIYEANETAHVLLDDRAHLLRRKKIINRARLVMLGVLPEYRNKGFDLLLIHEIVARAKVNGIIEGECGWTLEDNHSINHGIEAAGGVRNKTYRIYQKQL